MWTRIRVTRTVRTIASWYCSSTRSCATTPRHAGQPAGSGAASSSSTCAGMSRRRFGPYLGPPFWPGFLGADCGVPFENGAAWRFRVRWAAASSCLSRSRSRRSRSRSDARRARSCCRRSRSCSKRAISASFSAPSRRSPRLACWSSSTRFRDVRPKIRIHATIADARGFVQASPKNPMFPRVPTRYSITFKLAVQCQPHISHVVNSPLRILSETPPQERTENRRDIVWYCVPVRFTLKHRRQR